jgi:hypothetical protein
MTRPLGLILKAAVFLALLAAASAWASMGPESVPAGGSEDLFMSFVFLFVFVVGALFGISLGLGIRAVRFVFITLPTAVFRCLRGPKQSKEGRL